MLQFQLVHTPHTRVDSILKSYQTSISSSEGSQLFEDMTLLPRNEFLPSELEGKLLLDYSNDLSSSMDFDSLNLFLGDNDYIFSHQYTNLILYIDKPVSEIHTDGMWLYLAYSNSSEETVRLISKKITSTTDSIQFSIGQILKGFQNGNLDSYSGLKIISDGSLYNYSKLAFVFDTESTTKNPRMDVMYTK